MPKKKKAKGLLPLKDMLRGSKVVKKEAGKKEKDTGKKFAPEIVAAFEQWKTGSASLTTLATGLKKRPQALRHYLIVLSGGKDAYKKLREAGAGGAATEPFGGQTGATRVMVAINDADVPVITSASRTEGWTFRHMYVGPGKQEQVFVHISPDGQEYVAAKATERADLLYKSNGLASAEKTVRLRLLETSAVARKKTREEREQNGHQERAAAKKKNGNGSPAKVVPVEPVKKMRRKVG